MSISIPDISDDRLADLASRIQPVMRGRHGEFRYLKPVDPRGIAYLWEPQLAGAALPLEPVRDITTYHRFGFVGFFKPTIAEVLAQIPADLVDQIHAFEIVSRPETSSDLHADREAINAGFHRATTRLYAIAPTPPADKR